MNRPASPPSSMKKMLVLSFLLLGRSLLADSIVVYDGKDFSVVHAKGPHPVPEDPDRNAFLTDYLADLGHRDSFERTMDLVNPPAWGKTVRFITHGKIQFHPSFPRGFVCHLTLKHLLADHAYILTLNGNPAKPGNSLLSTPVAGNEQERYYDFLTITTDSRGRYDADLGIYLKPGEYNVRCYVKDTADFKIVLYRDFFEFLVK
jgi:hypothetical protein